MSGAKRSSPSPFCLMREDKASLQEDLRQNPQAQLRAKPPEPDEQDKIGGIFQIVERGSGAFVEEAWAS